MGGFLIHHKIVVGWELLEQGHFHLKCLLLTPKNIQNFGTKLQFGISHAKVDTIASQICYCGWDSRFDFNSWPTLLPYSLHIVRSVGSMSLFCVCMIIFFRGGEGAPVGGGGVAQ